MATSVKTKMKQMNARRRRRIEARASELIAEERSLRKLSGLAATETSARRPPSNGKPH